MYKVSLFWLKWIWIVLNRKTPAIFSVWHNQPSRRRPEDEAGRSREQQMTRWRTPSRLATLASEESMLKRWHRALRNSSTSSLKTRAKYSVFHQRRTNPTYTTSWTPRMTSKIQAHTAACPTLTMIRSVDWWMTRSTIWARTNSTRKWSAIVSPTWEHSMWRRKSSSITPISSISWCQEFLSFALVVPSLW